MFEDRAHQVIKSMDWLHSKCVLDVSEVHVKVDDYGWFAPGMAMWVMGQARTWRLPLLIMISMCS